MRYIFISLILFFLSGCSSVFLPDFCISPEDIKYVKYKVTVPTRPDVISDNYRDYWYDSGVRMSANEELAFNVVSMEGIGYCNQKPIIVDITGSSNDLGVVMDVLEGDKLLFDVMAYERNGNRFVSKDYEKISRGSVVGNFDGSSRANVWKRNPSLNKWINGTIGGSLDPEDNESARSCRKDGRLSNNAPYAINLMCGNLCTGYEDDKGSCYYSKSLVGHINNGNNRSYLDGLKNNQFDISKGEYLQGLRAKIIDRNGLFQELPRIGSGPINSNEYDTSKYPDDWPKNKFRNNYAEGIRMGFPYPIERDGMLSLYFHNYLPGLYKIKNRTNRPIFHSIASIPVENSGTIRKVWTYCHVDQHIYQHPHQEKDYYRTGWHGQGGGGRGGRDFWYCEGAVNYKYYDQVAIITAADDILHPDRGEIGFNPFEAQYNTGNPKDALRAFYDRNIHRAEICRVYFLHTKKVAGVKRLKRFEGNIPRTIEIVEEDVLDNTGTQVYRADGEKATRMKCIASSDVSDPVASSGGYRISVQHLCDISEKRGKLYYYIGDVPPPVLPGDIASIDTGIAMDSRLPYNIAVKSSSRGGKVFFGVQAPDMESYKRHRGEFKIVTSLPREGQDAISFIIRFIRDQVFRVFYGKRYSYNDRVDSDNTAGFSFNHGVIGNTFNGVTLDENYQAIIYAVLTLFIVIQSVAIMFGLIQKPAYDLFIMIMKISFVLMLIQPGSWSWFKETFFVPFIYGVSELINIFTFMGSSTVAADAGGTRVSVGDFHFIDALLYRFIVPETWMQIASFTYASIPMGWIMIIAITWGIWTLFQTIFTVLCIYMASVVAISILLIMAPIFIVFILFKRTKSFFDAWMKSIIQASMQPVFVFASIGLFIQILTAIIHDIFNFDACVKCVWELYILPGWTQCITKMLLPFGQSVFMFPEQAADKTMSGVGFIGFPIRVVAFILWMLCCYSFEKFVRFTSQMSLTIFGAPGSDLQGAGEAIAESAKGLVGQDKRTQDQQEDARHDQEDSKKRTTPTAGESPDKAGSEAQEGKAGEISQGSAKDGDDDNSSNAGSDDKGSTDASLGEGDDGGGKPVHTSKGGKDD